MPLTEDVPVRRRVSKRAIASEERREAILDAAVMAFGDLGYHATSLRDVAARVGMSHTGLLHHFPDKACLLEAVLDRRDRRDAADYGLETAGPVDGVTFVRGLVRLAERNVRDRAVVDLYATLAAEASSPAHPAHGYFVRRYEHVRTGVAKALRDIESRGLLTDRGLTVEMAACQIVAISDGLQTQWLLDPDRVDLVAGVRASLQLFVSFPL